MVKDNNNTTIQAFPITANTLMEILSAQDVTEYTLVHCLEATTLIFAREAGDLSIFAEAGADFGIGSGVTSLTSDVIVLLS